MKKRSHLNLDIVRGAAALIVVFAHLYGWAPFFSGYKWPWLSINNPFPGHIAVLVFFILSGYVIGLNHPVMESRKKALDYIKKRLVRIMPIYFIAIMFCLATNWGHYSWGAVFSNLFFISVPLNNVISENAPLWSLHFELIFYFVFIFFAWFRINLAKTVRYFLFFLALLVPFSFYTKINPLIINYFVGFLYWITGAFISKIAPGENNPVKASRIMSVFILIFCIEPFNPYQTFMHLLHITPPNYSTWSWYVQAISYSDLLLYPFAVLLMLALTHTYSKKYRPLAYIVFIMAIFQFVFLYVNYLLNLKPGSIPVPFPSLLLFAALVLWLLNFQVPEKLKRVLNKTSWLSRISYGIYIIHFPLLVVFCRLTYPKSFAGYITKMSLYLIVVLTSSYLLEEKFQPLVKKKLGFTKSS